MATDYAEGDTLYAADIDNLMVAAEKNGVLTGWTVAENGTPNMSVNVALGTGFAGGTYNSTVGDTNVVITASHATLHRLDLIVVNNAGTFSAIAGTPAATPNPPDLPDNSIILAQVYIAATVTTIVNANITQKGILLGSIKDQHIDDSAAIAWSKISKSGSNLTDLVTRSHTALTDKGSNTHPAIDSHISDTSSPHGTTMEVSVQVTTPKIYHGTGIIIQTPGDLTLSPSGQIIAKDTIRMDDSSVVFRSGSTNVATLSATSPTTVDLSTNVASGDIEFDAHQYVKLRVGSVTKIQVRSNYIEVYDDIYPATSENRALGSAGSPWLSVTACGFADICSSFPLPKGNILALAEDMPTLYEDDKKKGWIKTEKLPKFLVRESTDKKTGKKYISRDLSAFPGYQIKVNSELIRLVRTLEARLITLEAQAA